MSRPRWGSGRDRCLSEFEPDNCGDGAHSRGSVHLRPHGPALVSPVYGCVRDGGVPFPAESAVRERPARQPPHRE